MFALLIHFVCIAVIIATTVFNKQLGISDKQLHPTATTMASMATTRSHHASKSAAAPKPTGKKPKNCIQPLAFLN